MDIFNSGVDENSTPDIMFDITLGGTKTWQGGLNAKELVCLNAFACLCVEMQRISTLLTPCVHMCAAAKACPFVCRCHAIRPVLLQALLGRLKLLQGKQCMCLPLCLYSIYSQVVPYVPILDTDRQSGQISGQIAALQQLYSSR